MTTSDYELLDILTNYNIWRKTREFLPHFVIKSEPENRDFRPEVEPPRLSRRRMTKKQNSVANINSFEYRSYDLHAALFGRIIKRPNDEVGHKANELSNAHTCITIKPPRICDDDDDGVIT